MERIDITKIIYTKSLKNKSDLIDINVHKSIELYGQIYPIIVTPDYEIIKGRSIYNSLKKLEHKEVWVKKVECNKDQLYLELSLLVKTPNPIECFKLMENIDVDNNHLPFRKKEIKHFRELLKFSWDDFKKDDTKHSIF